MQRSFEEHVSPLEGSIREDDQFGFHKHYVKGWGVERKRTFDSQNIKGKGSKLLRNDGLVRKR